MQQVQDSQSIQETPVTTRTNLFLAAGILLGLGLGGFFDGKVNFVAP